VADYAFLTTWLLESPREPVWDAIYAQERWPEWWRGVERADEVHPGDGDRVGAVSRMVWRSFLPYRVEFEMEGKAVGELEGTGRWRLFEHDGVTAVLYEWNVKTTRAWMNLLAPLGRPVFAWNHNWVMARGGEGLARLLGCRLLVSG
jgi:uncharacterized protein YndB with AHSA1/START domain